jgi:uncharacterized protein with ParB-like and HNH nuclease domain
VALTAQERFKAESLTVTELFQLGTYEIPAFQRDYSWTKEQCEDLWGDLKNLLEGQVKAHFIGPMVVIRHGEKNQKNYLVIDGQQRLTTLQMIIALLRDHWVQLNPGKRQTPAGPKPFEDTCQSLLVSGPPSYTRTFVPNWHVREVFFDYVQRELGDDQRKTALKFADVPKKDLEYAEELFKAYVFFREKVSSLTVSQTEKFEEILLNDILILRIDAVEIENAFILFETLNNRGLDLTQGDLVKNLIFQSMKEPATTNLSPTMVKILGEWDDVAEKVSYKKLDSFLRYFLILKLKKKIQKEGISKEIEKEYGTTVRIKNFIQEVSEYSDLYALIERTDSFQGQYKIQLNALFDDLNDLNQATQAVFLLAALKRFSNWETKEHFEKLSKACRAAEVLSFRWLITGKNAQDLENIWRESAIKLLDEGLTDEDALQGAISHLKSQLPADQEFKTELSGRSLKSSKFVRYILRKIENSRIDNDVWVLAGPDKLDVEHVAPKTPDDTHDWRKVMTGESSYRNIIYRIGNQTLLTKSLNRSAKNKEFKDKKTQYQKNTGHLTQLTRELLTATTWTQQAVVKRSESLAKEALGLWNWAALSKDLKVTAAAPKQPKKRAAKKTAKKRATKKAAKKRATKKTARKPATEKAAKKGAPKGATK